MYCGPNLRLTYEVSSAFVKGLQLVVTNRSPEKAAQLAERCATFFSIILRENKVVIHF